MNEKMETIKILLMEDDERQFEIAQTMIIGGKETVAEKLMRKRGKLKDKHGEGGRYVLKWAKTGQEGLDMLVAEKTDNSFDMVLIDKSMPPGWDGLETMERVRDKFSELPIALITAYPMDVVMKECLAKVDGLILQKPYTKEEINALLQQLLSL